MSQRSLLVAGGGVAGMALALAASRHGGPAPAALMGGPPAPGGRFYALGETADRFLREEAGISMPQSAPARRFWLCAGGRRFALDAPAGGPPLCRIVSEDALLQSMEDALRASGVRREESLPSSCKADSQKISVQMEDGRALEADILACADGARSPTAGMLHVSAAVSPFGQRALTAMLEAPALEEDAAAQWFARRDILALLPAGGGKFAMVWSLPEDRARDLEAQGIDSVAEAAMTRADLEIRAGADATARSFPLAAARRAARVMPRTAFVGDAARVIHPLAGQGLNIGLADAALLLKCLRQRDSIPAALAEYASRSAPRAAALHALTAALNKGGQWAAPLFAAASFPPFARIAARAANC